MAEAFPKGLPLYLFVSYFSHILFPADPPIKRFAQKHSYANIDGIANSDLRVSQARKEKAAREKAADGL
ncbi:hypothetical protein DFH11DRAFT_1654061 [Phellopilus nigrolimitatus]|nr:hypothetical protein DFH11DRAFT_1654061 [Phellopilus nigrolimitatus]